MKLYRELNLKEFHFWGGALETADLLTEDELDLLQEYIESIEERGFIWTETELNDFFWFDKDWIAIFLDYNDFETLYKERRN